MRQKTNIDQRPPPLSPSQLLTKGDTPVGTRTCCAHSSVGIQNPHGQSRPRQAARVPAASFPPLTSRSRRGVQRTEITPPSCLDSHRLQHISSASFPPDCVEKWCHDYFLNCCALRMADVIRAELLEIVKRIELPCAEPAFGSKENALNIKKALLSGYFMQVSGAGGLQCGLSRISPVRDGRSGSSCLGFFFGGNFK